MRQVRPVFWWLLGGAVIAYVVATREKKISASPEEEEIIKTTTREQLLMVLPKAAHPYIDDILQVAKEEDVSPYLLTAIMFVESNYGQALKPPTPAGTGDGGHGRGLMQIDDRSAQEFLAKTDDNGTALWKIPYYNIREGARIFKGKRNYLGSRPRTPFVTVSRSSRKIPPGTYRDPRPLTGDFLFRAAVSAYNTGEGNVLKAVAAGLDSDTTTATGDYAAKVFKKMNELLRRAGQPSVSIV